MKKSTVLITGASGLIGTALTQMLLNNNYEVKHLGRKRKSLSNVTSYVWNIENNFIEPEAFDNVDYIVHLAGANIAERTWTQQYKKEILDSRLNSTKLLLNTLNEITHSVKKIIFTSAIGYYGMLTKDSPCTENTPPGTDFMAQICIQWENTMTSNANHIPKTIYRLGVVLSTEGGAYPKILKPIKIFGAMPLGHGKQIMSWIHINDACRAILYAIENAEIKGIYNLVAPNPVTNAEMMQTIARIYHKPYIPISVPSFVLKTILGEKANLALQGIAVSPDKLIKSGFQFQFEHLQEALKNLKNQKLNSDN